jgi:hypothetical protein
MNGQTLACLVCLVPFVCGFLAAWFIRPNTLRYGWMGLLPNRLRERIEDIKLRIQDE